MATVPDSTSTHPLAAPESGAAVRPTAVPRPTIRVRPLPRPEIGFHPSSPYVLRLWTQAIGAAATEELLRLAVAGRRRRRILRPIFLHVLIEAGVIEVKDGVAYAPYPIPPIPEHLAVRLGRRERALHERWVTLLRRRHQTGERRVS